jgi:hypothetical protein
MHPLLLIVTAFAQAPNGGVSLLAIRDSQNRS